MILLWSGIMKKNILNRRRGGKRGHTIIDMLDYKVVIEMRDITILPYRPFIKTSLTDSNELNDKHSYLFCRSLLSLL